MIGLKIFLIGDQIASQAGFLVHMASTCSVFKMSVVWMRAFLANSITRSRSYRMALLTRIIPTILTRVRELN
jgi:hypothetical protein